MNVNRRELSVCSLPISSKKGIYRDTPILWGVSHNRSTSGSYKRQTGQFVIYTPIIVSSITIDVRNTGSYKLSFLTTGAGSTDLYVVQSAQVVGAAGAITFPASNEFILMPGIYFISLYRDAGAVTWWDGPVYTTTNLDTAGGTWYDGSRTATYYFALTINGRKIGFPGLSSFVKSPI